MIIKNISKVIGDDAKVNKIGGRYLINEFEPQLELTIIKRLQKIFGLISVSPADEIDTDLDQLEEYCKKIRLTGTFKVKSTLFLDAFTSTASHLMKENLLPLSFTFALNGTNADSAL